MGFPVVARGVIPVPGGKEAIGVQNGMVRCGGVDVAPGDCVVADEEGVVVVPVPILDEVLDAARMRVDREAAQSLDEWEVEHRARIEAILRERGFSD